MPESWTRYTGPAGGGDGWTRYKPPKPRRRRPPRARPMRPTPPVRRTFTDPFAALTDQQLRERARSQTQSALGPLVDSIRQAIEARSRSGQAAISGLTRELGGLWAGVAPAAGQIYERAQGQQRQVNTDLANRLGSFGQGLQGEITGKLQAQGAPQGVVGEIAGGAGTTAQGVANANFAKGSAGLEALLAQGAAEQAYGAKLPGIAGLTGQQHGRQLEAQLSQSLADQLGQIGARGAGDESSLYTHLLDLELQKAIAKQSGLINQDKLAADTRYKNQTLRYKQQKDRYDRQIKQQSLGISQQRVNEYARHNGISEQQASQRLIQQAQRNQEARRSARVREAQARANEAGRTKRSKKKGKGGGAPWQRP